MTTEKETAPAPSRKRKWGRRLLKLLVVCAVLAVVLRIALPFVLPPVLDAVVAGYGLTCEYEDIDLSLTTGEVRVTNLELRARGAGGEPPGPVLCRLEFATADLDVSALFTGQLRVHRVEADGLDVLVERDAAGRLLWAKHLPPPAAAPAVEAAPAPPSAAPIDLALPVVVDAVRAQHVRVRLLDRHVTPPIDTWVEAQVRVSDLGYTERQARVSLHVFGPDVLDNLTVDGTVQARSEAIDGELRCSLAGLRLGPLAPWLRPFGFVPCAERLAAGAGVTLAVRRSKAQPATAEADLAVRDLSLSADGVAGAGIDAVTVAVRGLGGAELAVPAVEVRGVRGSAARSAGGVLQVAGLELCPVTAAPPAAPPAPVVQPAAAGGAPVALRLDTLRVRDVALTLSDAAVQPAVNLQVAVDEVAVRDVRLPAPTADSTVSVGARIPGVVEKLLIEARVRPFGARRTASVDVRAAGITFERVRPYLAALGLAPELEAGEFGCALQVTVDSAADGSHAASAELREVRFRDAGDDLFALDGVAVRDVVVAAGGGSVRVGAVAVQGGTFAARRAADGVLHAFGLRTGGAPVGGAAGPVVAAPVAAAPVAAPSTPAGAGVPVRIELGEVRWQGAAVQFTDAAVDPPLAVDVGDFDVQLRGLALGGARRDAADVATVAAGLQVKGIAGRLGARGEVRSRPGPLDLGVDLQIEAGGLSLMPLAPYLKELGVEPTLSEGSAKARLQAAVSAPRPGALHLDATLADVELRQAGAEPAASLRALQIEGVELDAAGCRVASVSIDGPVARIDRDERGGLLAMGLRVPPPAPAPKAPAAGGPAAQAPAAKAPAAEPVAPARAPFALGRLDVRDAELSFRDRAVEPALATSIRAALEVEGLTTAPAADPTEFSVRVDVPEVLQQARLDGSVTVTDGALRVQAKAAMAGLRAGPLAAYVPPGVEVTLRDGRAGFTLDARLRQQGSTRGLELTIGDIAFRDGEAGEPMAACGEVRVAVPVFDPARRRLEIAELAVRGVQLSAARPAADQLALLGLKVDLAAGKRTAAAPDQPRSAGEVAVVEAAAQPGGQAGTRTPWHVAVGKLELELARLRFLDAGAAQPLDARLRLVNGAPWVLLDAEPEDLAPIALQVEGAVVPLVDSITASATFAPFKADPELKGGFLLRGIRGARLHEVLPSLRGRLDLAELPGGRLGGALEAHLHVERRHPTDLDLGRGFGLDLEVRDVALRDAEDGEVLLGVDSIHVDAPRIVPGGRVHVRSVEVGTPRGRVRKDGEGIHVAGLTLPLPPPSAAEPAPAPAATAPAAPAPATTVRPSPAEMPEIRVDRLSVQGIDVSLVDASADPPLTVPLNGFDLDVTNLTTKALTEARNVDFALSATAGDVRLPVRQSKASSPIAGVLSGVGKLVTGGAEKLEFEARPLLGEVAVAGRLALFPQLSGRVRTSVHGFELGALRGVAKQAGVELSDGLLEGGIDLRLQGGDLAMRSRFVLDELSIDEASGGPISTYLTLPAPLQTVVFALRDESGAISIPLNVTVQDAKLGSGELLSASLSTFSTLVAKAVAAAPLRVVGSVTDLIGLTGGAEESVAEKRESLAFAPGAATVGAGDDAPLRRLIELLGDDDRLVVVLAHSFGEGDFERAKLLANPTPDQARALVERLRQERQELARGFGEAAARARSYHAIGREDSARAAVSDLQRIARRRAEVEDGLDFVLDLLRPGAERRSTRRTRRMALGIGERRLEAVRRRLLELGGDAMRDRIEVRRPRLEATPGGAGGQVMVVPKVRSVRDT